MRSWPRRTLSVSKPSLEAFPNSFPYLIPLVNSKFSHQCMLITMYWGVGVGENNNFLNHKEKEKKGRLTLKHKLFSNHIYRKPVLKRGQQMHKKLTYNLNKSSTSSIQPSFPEQCQFQPGSATSLYFSGSQPWLYTGVT